MEYQATEQQCLNIESLDSSDAICMMKLLTATVAFVYIICAAKMSQFKAATLYQNIVEDNARSFP